MEQVKHRHHHVNSQAEIDSLAEAISQLSSAKQMIEEMHDCSEVLNMIAAVKTDLNNTAALILDDHINHCVVDAVETGDKQTLKDLTASIHNLL
ncbi:MAG: metal-sensing transcriptional repressor [bacterium]|nr:metal-sensing transcriptional repressor [bacterium]